MNQRREKILDIFIQLIEQYGIDKTTVQDLAKKVCCSVGTLYSRIIMQNNQRLLYNNRKRATLIQLALDLEYLFIIYVIIGTTLVIW